MEFVNMADQTLLLKNADILCTMQEGGELKDNRDVEIKGGGLFARMAQFWGATGERNSIVLCTLCSQAGQS